MTEIIEVTDRITSENFVVNPDAMRNFLKSHFGIDSIPVSSIKTEKFLGKYADEIDRISRDTLMDMNRGGYSNLLHIDYGPGIYRDEIPACGWVKVED